MNNKNRTYPRDKVQDFNSCDFWNRKLRIKVLGFQPLKTFSKVFYKKGFFFTIIGVFLSFVLILAFNVYKEENISTSTTSVETRITTVNNFIKDVENDIQKGIFIITSRTFIGLLEYVSEQGEFLPDMREIFQEAFLNGTVESSTMDILVNSTFPDWVESIQMEADDIDVRMNFTIGEVDIFHPTPWHINITVNLTLNISDNRDTAAWYRSSIISSRISINDYEDPLYIVNTLGKVTNTILHTNFTPFVVDQDVTNFNIHLNDSYYINTNLSPTFLMRMEGNLSANPLGIESLVNLKKLQDQGISTSSRSAVDYVYWGNQTTSNNRINNTPSWLYIDDEHLSTYGVENLTI